MASERQSTEKTSDALQIPEYDASLCLVQYYTPLLWSALKEAEQVYLERKAELDEAWEKETVKYEEMVNVSIDGKDVVVPRRNYFNKSGIIQDESLYPYHSILYDLIDAYDCLYDNESDHPIESESIRLPRVTRGDGTGRFLVANHTSALLHINHELPDHVNGENSLQFEFACSDFSDTNASYQEWFRSRPALLQPPECSWNRLAHLRIQERSEVLLKITRHSLSELQRDLALANLAIRKLTESHDLDDVNVLNGLLATLHSEFIVCKRVLDVEDEEDDDDEDAVEDHDCGDWELILTSGIPNVIAFGLTYLTEEHATAIAAFVRACYKREFGDVLRDRTPGIKKMQRTRLKRHLQVMRDDDADLEFARLSSKSIPCALVVALIKGLGARAFQDRVILYSDEMLSKMKDNAVKRTLDSYINCVRALVDIAEVSPMFLTANSRFYSIVSAIPRSLWLALKSEPTRYMPGTEEIEAPDYIGTHPDSRCLSLSCSHRFAEKVSNATAVSRDLGMNTTAADRSHIQKAIHHACFGTPHADIRDAIKVLYCSGMVDVRDAGLGYGDFLLFCRFDISPCDPLLFWHECAYPVEEDSDSSSDESSVDSGDVSVNWETDEADHFLRRKEIQARYDFSLYCLQAAWSSPWTAESHMSFAPLYREAVTTVSQCLHRCAIPNEILPRIVEYIPRDSYPDDRWQCFLPSCLEEQMARLNQHKLKMRQGKSAKDANPVPFPKYRCSVCRSRTYCSKACYNKSLKVGHSQNCCRPPCCVPNDKDREKIKNILDIQNTYVVSSSPTTAATVSHPCESEEVENGIDDASWESVSSGDNSEDDRSCSEETKRIVAFFESCYQ